jgi:hypothetical protein
MNFVLVGDIHSQFTKFERAVKYALANIENCHLILLGDAFDSRCSESNSVSVFKLIKDLQNKNLATIIHSNHQWKLQRYLYGNSVSIDQPLQQTIDDFSNSDVSSQELLTWLESLPYALAFKDKDNQEYRCAHAYYSSKLFVPCKYEGIYKINTISKISFKKAIYGLSNTEGDRVFWWNTPSKHKWIRCAGHYHVLDISHANKSIILDSLCGEENGILSLYDVNSKQLHQF